MLNNWSTDSEFLAMLTNACASLYFGDIIIQIPIVINDCKVSKHKSTDGKSFLLKNEGSYAEPAG